jgi:hypothetical protein
MASVRSGGQIFAIATTPRSENPKPVAAIAFAKSTVVITSMGTMQIKGSRHVTMRTFVFVIIALTPLLALAEPQQTRFYDSHGNAVGTAVPQGDGSIR